MYWYIITTPQNDCFRGYTGISLSVCLSVCPSVCLSVYKIIVSVKALVGVLIMLSVGSNFFKNWFINPTTINPVLELFVKIVWKKQKKIFTTHSRL